MPNLLEEIRDDILNDIPISTLLRKALYLAYELNSAELKEWVEHELNGYPNIESVPEYRRFTAVAKGSYITINVRMSGAQIPLSWLPRGEFDFTQIFYRPSVSTIEAVLATQQTNTQGLRLIVAPEVLDLLNELSTNANWYEVWMEPPVGTFAEILGAIRTRLLIFVMELKKRHPSLAIPGFRPTPEALAEIRHLTQTVINGDMTTNTFNQQNQQVDTQYNAGRDTNIDPPPVGNEKQQSDPQA